MMKKILLLFFVFAFSLSFAQLINYAQTVDMGTMRTYIQTDSTYFVSQDVRYYLDTELSIPSSQSYRWISGTGAYNDIHDGDVICEGIFYYDTSVHASVDRGDFDGVIPSTSGTGSPGTWDNCGSGDYSSCPEGNINVLWGNPIYGESDHAGREISSSHYRNRKVTFEEVVGGTTYSNEATDVATIMEGTASLGYFRLGGYSLYHSLHSFDPLSGTTPSHSDSFSIYTTNSGDYGFNQRMDVTGATILTYTKDMSGNNEKVWSYDSMSMSLYTRSNIHDSAAITVLDEDDVGIIDPYILSVDMGSDGPDGSGPYEVSPGADIPVTITMVIPNRPSNYYALPFEFYNVNVGGPTGMTFAETSGIDQCSSSFYFARHINGGWFLPYQQYYSDIEGTLHIPDTLAEGIHQIPFSVEWRSCAGAGDCDGNGFDEETPDIFIEIEIPDDDGLLPDLICTVEPLEYVTGTDHSDGFEAGEGVQSWRVTVTNIGPGNATIDTDNYLCSAVILNAYSSDGSSVLDPLDFTVEAIFPTALYGLLEPGQSSIVDFEDVPAICIDDSDDQIEAFAAPNWLAFWYPDCIPYMLEEVDHWNNLCTWEAPCNQSTGEEEPGDEYCVIIPPTDTGYPGSHHEFDIFCYNDEGDEGCTGGVDWAITHGATYVDSYSGNDVGADVYIITGLSVLDTGEHVIIEATWDDDVQCEGEILLPPMDCYDFI